MLHKGIQALKKGEFKRIFRGIGRIIGKGIYRIRARIEDWCVGKVSVDKRKTTKYAQLGAKDTESTNYDWLDQMFKAYPVNKNGAFVDVGCGEGRVLTYLYLRHFRGPMTGIELDPEIAEIARKRTKNCANITIANSNVLECAEVIEKASFIYLFNPFQREILIQFVELLEQVCKHPVIVYYCNDIYRDALDKRPGWYILRRNVMTSPAYDKRDYTVYGFLPEEMRDERA